MSNSQKKLEIDSDSAKLNAIIKGGSGWNGKLLFWFSSSNLPFLIPTMSTHMNRRIANNRLDSNCNLML
jgi:hypothetical protein